MQPDVFSGCPCSCNGGSYGFHQQSSSACCVGTEAELGAGAH
jgi:hypothetical protein